MNKFSCKNCGACCKDFGSFGTLPLFSDEVEKYKKCDKEAEIELEFVPENVLLDKVSGSAVCLNWGMKGNPCKFLKNNLCGIYKNRSLICKAFPLEKIPEKEGCVKFSCFMDCPENSLNDFVHEASLVKEFDEPAFIEMFGKESFDARVEIERRKRFIGDSLKKLKEENKADFVEAEFLDSRDLQVVDIFEFLKNFGIAYT